jgi:hypothetical protein
LSVAQLSDAQRQRHFLHTTALAEVGASLRARRLDESFEKIFAVGVHDLRINLALA